VRKRLIRRKLRKRWREMLLDEKNERNEGNRKKEGNYKKKTKKNDNKEGSELSKIKDL